MNLIVLMGACFVCAAGETPAGLPEELAQLNAFVQEEKALVDAMRAFDKQQTALAEAEMKEAEALAKKGDKDTANAKQKKAEHRFHLIRKGYEFVLHQYHNDARAQTYYGELLYDRFGEFPGALQAWELAIALDSKLSAPRNDLGIHYCHVGDYARGLRFHDEAIKLEPNNADYLYNVVQTYLVNFPAVQKIRKWRGLSLRLSGWCCRNYRPQIRRNQG